MSCLAAGPNGTHARVRETTSPPVPTSSARPAWPRAQPLIEHDRREREPVAHPPPPSAMRVSSDLPRPREGVDQRRRVDDGRSSCLAFASTPGVARSGPRATRYRRRAADPGSRLAVRDRSASRTYSKNVAGALALPVPGDLPVLRTPRRLLPSRTTATLCGTLDNGLRSARISATVFSFVEGESDLVELIPMPYTTIPLRITIRSHGGLRPDLVSARPGWNTVSRSSSAARASRAS